MFSQDFLSYLYSDRIETLSDENMLELFITADRYQVNKLKDLCMNYIENTITVDNFCEVLALALQHNQKSLVTLSTQFFLQNSLQIVLTSK